MELIKIESMKLVDLEKAIVYLPVKGGRGVLIPGEMILTAAHCISCNCSSRMTLNEDNPVKVLIKQKPLLLNVIFVDPVSDIAVLGALTEYDDNVKYFLNYCDSTKPFKLGKPHYQPFEYFTVKVYNKNKQWVEAAAQLTNSHSHKLSLNVPVQIEPGASGGPIINDNLQLVSIVSNCTTSGGFHGSSPLPHLTLPKWILQNLR